MREYHLEVLQLEIVVGKTNDNKINYMSEKVLKNEEVVVLLDYRGIYNHIDGHRIDLGTVNPFLTPLCYEDARSINAGVVEYSSFLANRSKEVLKDYAPSNIRWDEYYYDFLIEDALQRSLSSWDDNEMEYAYRSQRFLNFNKAKQVNTIDEVIDESSDKKMIILEATDLHSTKIRLLTFLFLTRFKNEGKSFTFVSDHANMIFKDGFLFNFVKNFNFEDIQSVFSFNKIENAPKWLLKFTKKITIFDLETKKELENARSAQYKINHKKAI